MNWGAIAESAASSGASGVLSDLMNFFTLGAANRNQNALNRNLQRSALQMQSDQFAASLQHDSNMAQQNYMLQKLLMEYQDDLNSPERVVQKLLKAGISPAYFFGQGSSSPFGNVGSMSSHGSTVAGGVGIPSGSSLPAFGSSSPILEGSEILKNLTQSGLNEQERAKIEKLLPQMFERGVLDIEQANNYVESQKIDNYIKNEVKDVRVKKEYQELENLRQDVAIKMVMQDNYDADTDLKRIQASVESIVHHTKDFQLKFMMKTWYERWQAEIQNLRQDTRLKAGQTENQYSQANLATAYSQTENALREWRFEAEKYGALMNKSDFAVKNGTELQRMNEIVNRCLASEYMPEQAKQDVERARKDNNWYEVNRLLDITNTAINAYSAYATGGFANAAQVRANVEREYQQHRMNNYEIDYTFKVPNSNTTVHQHGYRPYPNRK